ncbi:MAG: ATP-binding protein [Gemmatimonadaceae bacterium]
MTSSIAPVRAVPSSAVVQPAPFLQDNPPNARRTMEALREMGYDSYGAVMDLVDNAIDAQAENIFVLISESKGDIHISILDDGIGMDESTLSEALRLGSDTAREPGDLGKFGMGLVTASISLSRRVEVATKEAGASPLQAGFDLDVIAEQNRFVKWLVDVDPTDVAELGDHGTLVRLSKTDRITNRRPHEFADRLRKRMGQVFRKFLTSGPTKIRVNDRPVEKIDPLMLNDPNTKLMLETEIGLGDSAVATLRVVDLPDYGQAGNKAAGIIPQNSGFYIVRNNREIMEAHAFDFYKKHPDYSHFRAEISFDGTLDVELHTDIKKMFVQPPQAFLDKLRQLTQGLISQSGRAGRARANATRGQIDHSAAEGNISRRASLIPKPKALLERRVPRGSKSSHSRGAGERDRNPHVTELRTPTGLKVQFEEGDYGEQSPFYLVKQEGKTITVTYNREHPFWR